jgi:frataxin-like iron-binding protein CyaY
LKASQTPYVVTVTDQNNCQVSENYVVPFPLYGELYVRAFSFSYNIGGVDLSRIIIRFKGGHGGPYHFRLPNGNWINLGNPYTQNLPVSSYLTNNSDYSVYESTTQINGSPTYEFQFWASDAPGGVAHYPLQFDYYLTDGNQQNTYAMFRAKMALTNTGTNGGAQDSNYGTNSPYGCYSYKNNNGTAVNGSAPQGVLLTQPN